MWIAYCAFHLGDYKRAMEVSIWTFILMGIFLDCGKERNVPKSLFFYRYWFANGWMILTFQLRSVFYWIVILYFSRNMRDSPKRMESILMFGSIWPVVNSSWECIQRQMKTQGNVSLPAFYWEKMIHTYR